VRIVAALGGNALLERGEAPDAEIQEEHVRRAVESLAPIIREHDLVITHGNGPQVGVLALESAADPALGHPYPFDVLGAETQGLIGNWLLGAIGRTMPGHDAVCLLTRTVVDAHDPAFSEPTKFVGPIYSEIVAKQLATERGWKVRADGSSWRRVVPSPEPAKIVELESIRTLIKRQVTVICAGGGGIPVVKGTDGCLHGVEAVIDKDLTSSLLAQLLDADLLLLLTDVANVEFEYGTPHAKPIERTSVEELRGFSFAAGSMGPKVEAACRFVERANRTAAIGRLDDAGRLVSGDAGTIVVPAHRENGAPEGLSSLPTRRRTEWKSNRLPLQTELSSASTDHLHLRHSNGPTCPAAAEPSVF
jgi:carbamate kinase